MKNIPLFVLIACVGLIVGWQCASKSVHTEAEGQPAEEHLVTDQQAAPEARLSENELFSRMSSEALINIYGNPVRSLASLAHPVKGIRFSPYTYIDTVKSVVLKPVDFEKLDTTIYRKWGVYDGEGSTIRLRFMEYYRQFVMNRNYIATKEISVDTLPKRGNSLNNIREVYPNAKVIEYYVPDSNPKTGGFDWHALRLVYEKYENKWYLVAIVQDQWTS